MSAAMDVDQPVGDKKQRFEVKKVSSDRRSCFLGLIISGMP